MERVLRLGWALGIAGAVVAASAWGEPQPGGAGGSEPAGGVAGGASFGTGGAYKPERGPHEVVTVEELVLTNEARGMRTPVKIRAPRPTAERPGPFPMVVFSHGAGGSGDAFPELTEHWASWGYVVVLPTHGDSIRRRRGEGEDAARLAEEFRGGQFVRRVNPAERRADVVLVLDSIPAIVGACGARVDAARIGMAGHSAGAFTTQLVAGVTIGEGVAKDDGAVEGKGAGGVRAAEGAGERARLGDRVRRRMVRGAVAGRSFGDDRIRAAVVISGQGLTNRALDEKSWDGLTLPMLVIAGSRDTTSVSNETPESRRHPYEYAPAGDKYLMYIEGATHASYAGKRASRVVGEEPPGNIGYITDVVSFGTTAFLDAYLLEDAGARAYLASGGPGSYAGGTLEWRSK